MRMSSATWRTALLIDSSGGGGDGDGELGASTAAQRSGTERHLHWGGRDGWPRYGRVLGRYWRVYGGARGEGRGGYGRLCAGVGGYRSGRGGGGARGEGRGGLGIGSGCQALSLRAPAH
jgi:hypothetical protein